MKTLKNIESAFAIGAMLFAMHPVVAGEIAWKGGGSTSAWSDGTNWEGGSAPGNGDTAVVPNGKVAYMSSADLVYVASEGLSLISLPGGDSTLYITNNTTSTLSVPVAGIGKFNVANNNRQLTIGVDNPDFTGPFYFTNSQIRTDYDHGLCFGRKNVITNYVGNGDASLYIFKGADYSNEWHIVGGSTAATGANRSIKTYSNSVRLCGPVHVYGYYDFSSQQNTTLTLAGGVYHSGAGNIRLNASVRIIGDAQCDFQTDASDNTGLCIAYGSTVELGSTVSATTPRIGGVGMLRFLGPNLLSSATAYQNGYGSSKGMQIDLNGFDQRCGTICKYNNDGTTEDNSFITSETAAKLTVYGQVEYNGYPAGKTSRFIALSLRGAASLELNGTNEIKTAQGESVWPMMEIRNCPTKSDTTGGLCVRRGTLTLAETTSWPNLSRLEAHDEGLLVMNTDGVNTNGFVFVASNVVDAAVTIAAGKHLHAKSAYVDKWLEPGEYGGSAAGLDESHTLRQLGGSGTLYVEEWGGPKGFIFVFR